MDSIFGMNAQEAQATLALAAIVVSVVALFVAFWTAHTQRVHNRLSVRPLAEVLLLDSEGHIRIRLRNHGTGPLIVHTLRVLQPHRQTLRSLIDAMPDNEDGWTFFVGPVDGRSVSAGGEIDLLEFEYDATNTEERQLANLSRVALQQLTLELDYHDIYSELMPKYVRSLAWFGRTLDSVEPMRS